MGVGGQRHAPIAWPPGKTRYPLYRRLGWPQGPSGRARKISPLPAFEPWTVQPVASCCTESAIPAQDVQFTCDYPRIDYPACGLWDYRELIKTMTKVGNNVIHRCGLEQNPEYINRNLFMRKLFVYCICLISNCSYLFYFFMEFWRQTKITECLRKRWEYIHKLCVFTVYNK
jgi:hypothetical protein